jgi:beta-glucanase (GH16 family)
MTTAVTAINTLGDALGDPLDLTFIRPGFGLTFATMPTWRVGKAEPLAAGVAPPALTDPSFTPLAGYVHAAASQMTPAYVPPGKPYPGWSWLNGNLEAYPNGDAIAGCGCSPFSVANDILTITAEPLPAAVLPWLPLGCAAQYLSGALCSYPFSQTYGYWEVRAKIPAGRGLWPAFWLVPTTLQWPPECDAMEVLGQTPGILYTTLHSVLYKAVTNPSSSQMAFATNTVDMSQGFHRFGVDWGPEKTRFYLDRQLVFSQPTPADFDQPMYWIVNLGIGGPTTWPGAPDATTPFPARFQIPEINVWQRPAYVAA